MDWRSYAKLVDNKISECKYNWEQAEEKARQARAAYDAAIREKNAFDAALIELMEDESK